MLDNQVPRKILLIDDDPIFLAIMTRIAEHEGVDLDIFSSIFEMGNANCNSHYDAAIIDYDLGNITGLEVASILTDMLGSVPMIIISESNRTFDAKSWPRSVRAFLKKSTGYSSIIFNTQLLTEGKVKLEPVTGLN